MVPCACIYGVDERGAGGGVDDQVAQCSVVERGGLFKLETDVVCIR